jgi:hypothetical protein
MADGCYDLRDMTAAAIRLYCPDCHRFAQFNTARLLERFGPHQAMPSLLGKLKPCQVGGRMSGPQCQLVYWDAMNPEKRRAAIDRGGIPESWPAE